MTVFWASSKSAAHSLDQHHTDGRTGYKHIQRSYNTGVVVVVVLVVVVALQYRLDVHGTGVMFCIALALCMLVHLIGARTQRHRLLHRLGQTQCQFQVFLDMHQRMMRFEI